MPKDEQISGAPYPIQISGKTYRARTLTDKDYDELNAWVRWKFTQESKDTIDKMTLMQEDRREMLSATMLAASQVTFNSIEGSRIANDTSEGFARVGWQMIHHYHPKLTIEQFTKSVCDEDPSITSENLRQINEAFIYLNIGPLDDDADDESEPGEDSDELSKSN